MSLENVQKDQWLDLRERSDHMKVTAIWKSNFFVIKSAPTIRLLHHNVELRDHRQISFSSIKRISVDRLISISPWFPGNRS